MPPDLGKYIKERMRKTEAAAKTDNDEWLSKQESVMPEFANQNRINAHPDHEESEDFFES